MHNRVKLRYFGSPVLMEQSYVNKYLSVLNSSSDITEDDSSINTDFKTRCEYNPDTCVGIIDISGGLTYKPTPMSMLCGGYSYQEIENDFQQLADSGAKVIITMFDTPGGEAYGAFETATELRRIADKCGAKWVSYNDGMIASAGYILSAPSDTIIVNPDSETGSIGVVSTLINDNRRLSEEGIDRTFVYAGKNKIPFAEDGSWSEDYITDLQMKINVLYMKFVKHVADFRPMSENEVRATNANMFTAEDALLNHLADKKMTRMEFADYICQLAQGIEPHTDLLKGNDNMNVFEKFLGIKKEAAISTDSAYAEIKKEYEVFATDAAAKYDEMQTKLESVTKECSEWKSKFNALSNSVKDSESLRRTNELVSLFGEAEASNIGKILSKLDDSEYTKVVNTMKAKQDIADNAIEAEIGFSGESKDEIKLEDVSGTKKLLAAKYGKKG